MAINLGWCSQLNKKFGFGGGSENSPFEADRYWIGVVFMVKIFFCVFYKKKRCKYEDELGSKKIRQPIPGNGPQNACWYFLTHIEIIHKRTKLPL